MTLIERLKDQRDRDAAEHCPAEIIALQDETIAAIEAQEAENKRLQQETINRSCNEAKLRAERDALAAKLATLEADAERLDWLEQNIFNRENVDWVTGKVSKTHNMWVMFAPVGVQGSARRIIDAAKGGQPVELTDEQIDRAALEQTGFDGYGTQAMNNTDIRRIVRAVYGFDAAKGGQQ